MAKFMTRTRSSFSGRSNCHTQSIQGLFHRPFSFQTHECTFPIKQKYASLYMCIHRINWICKFIKNRVAILGKVSGVFNRSLICSPSPSPYHKDQMSVPPHPTSPQALDPSNDGINLMPMVSGFPLPWSKSSFSIFLNFTFLSLFAVD